MEHPDYYKLREQLIEFLEVRAHRKNHSASREGREGREGEETNSPIPTIEPPVSVVAALT